FYHRIPVGELRAVYVFGGLRAVYVGATPLARGRACARAACALACAGGAADCRGAALGGGARRPVAHGLEGMEVALGQNLAGRLAQVHRRGGEDEEAAVEEEADDEDYRAGDDADGGAIYEDVEAGCRVGVDIDLQVPARGEQDENPEVVASKPAAQGLPLADVEARGLEVFDDEAHPSVVRRRVG